MELISRIAITPLISMGTCESILSKYMGESAETEDNEDSGFKFSDILKEFSLDLGDGSEDGDKSPIQEPEDMNEIKNNFDDFSGLSNSSYDGSTPDQKGDAQKVNEMIARLSGLQSETEEDDYFGDDDELEDGIEDEEVSEDEDSYVADGEEFVPEGHDESEDEDLYEEIEDIDNRDYRDEDSIEKENSDYEDDEEDIEGIYGEDEEDTYADDEDEDIYGDDEDEDLELENYRLEREKDEREKAEKAERERLEQERIKRELAEKERLEQEERDRAERARIEADANKRAAEIRRIKEEAERIEAEAKLKEAQTRLKEIEAREHEAEARAIEAKKKRAEQERLRVESNINAEKDEQARIRAEKLNKLAQLKAIKAKMDQKVPVNNGANTPGLSSEKELEFYGKMEPKQLILEVKKFAAQEGIQNQVILREVLDKKFGKQAINKLVMQSYLIVVGKGVTF